tara:strand:+ start:9112 stop:9351 length:240 start_codon:yes stop_codon:yes gene_type:complete
MKANYQFKFKENARVVTFDDRDGDIVSDRNDTFDNTTDYSVRVFSEQVGEDDKYLYFRTENRRYYYGVLASSLKSIINL